MKILYMGYYCNEDFFNELVEKGSKSSHARQQLEYKLLSGIAENLEENDFLKLVSYLPKVEGKLEKGEIWRGRSVSYAWCNKKNPFSVLKTLLNNMGRIIYWSVTDRDEKKVIFVYSVNLLHTLPALTLRKCLHYKVVTLSPEISIYRRKGKLVSTVSRKIERVLDNSFDGYILLTKYMNELINHKNRPSMVMEGIADFIKKTDQVIFKKKAVLYAGNLSRDNGVFMLLKAFSDITDCNWELWICGDGELKEEIAHFEKKYKNIKYLGVLPNCEVRYLEQEASLLINPRFSKNIFTKYSFPSKTIEYMASGTATVITRLMGIPDEYFKYVYVLEDESVEGTKHLLQYLFSLRSEELTEKARQAKEYVLKEKNVHYQGKRVVDFLRKVV